MENVKRLKTTTVNGDGTVLPELPEDLIQHIQSFLTGKEAAQTTVLSKSWYHAWLTRPKLDFDQDHFKNRNDKSPQTALEEFATKHVQRCLDLNLKIDCLRIRTTIYKRSVENLANRLTVKALKLGATDLNLELRSVALSLPHEVLESETLLRLSVSRRKISDGNIIRCSLLKSLSLHEVHMEGSGDMLRNIVSCCVLLEELSISHCRLISSFNSPKAKLFVLSGTNLPELPKLRCLFLENVNVGTFFCSTDDFAVRFPCLKDLSLVCCFGYKSIKIGSTSLEKISFLKVTAPLNAELDVPNLVELRYSGKGLPSIDSITSSRKWDFYISLPKNSPGRGGRGGGGGSRMVILQYYLLREWNPSKVYISFDY